MRVLVCGDRNWTDPKTLNDVLNHIHETNGPITMIIEGEARGADLMGRWWAEARNIPILPFPAEWGKYGRAAGPIRNRQQFDEGKPDLVVAFHNNLESSKGTKDMVGYAKLRKCPTEVYSNYAKLVTGK